MVNYERDRKINLYKLYKLMEKCPNCMNFHSSRSWHKHDKIRLLGWVGQTLFTP